MIWQARTTFGFLLCGVMTLLLSGCDAAPPMIEVKGVVTLDDQPVQNALVTFAPVGTGIASVGETDATGHFVLKSQTDQGGAVAGQYRVTVIKMEAVAGGPAATEGGLLGFAPPGMQEKWLVPSRYANFDTSGLTVEVKPGMPEVQLKLSNAK